MIINACAVKPSSTLLNLSIFFIDARDGIFDYENKSRKLQRENLLRDSMLPDKLYLKITLYTIHKTILLRNLLHRKTLL